MLKDEVIERALKYISETKDSKYKIAKYTGLSESAIGRYANKTSRPTLVNAKLLIQYFENNSDSTFEANPVSDIQFINIPFVPVHAQAGYGKGYGDLEYIERLPTIPVIVDKNYNGKYRVFEVDGDSMDDGSRSAIYDGDKILCREVKPDLWRNKLHYRDWYFVIAMRDNGVLIKQIVNHDVDTGNIVCHSLNPLFDDFEVNLNDVAELYNVIKIVDRNTRL